MIGKIYHYFKLTFTFLVSYYKLYRKKYKKGTFCYQEYKDNKKCKETLFCTFEHNVIQNGLNSAIINKHHFFSYTLKLIENFILLHTCNILAKSIFSK